MSILPSIRRFVRRWLCLPAAALVLPGSATAGMWDPLPMTVHEWGVNTFDWDLGDRLHQELPGFLYTDQKPGKLIAKPEERVRDLPADSGIRTKPILYFYLPEKFQFEKPAQVGVEMRFGYGYANAWWPQVNVYRDAKTSQAAAPPDWKTWKEKLLKQAEKAIKGTGENPEAVERWKQSLKVYQSLDEQSQIAWLANQMRWFGESDFPEDGRMQLVWERLTLHHSLPEDQSLPGEDLPDDHWVKLAREVDAAYVRHGDEAERYVFYEGKTSERPAIAVLPRGNGPNWMRPQQEAARKDLALVNIGAHPIFDVTAIYRDSEKGILWVGSIPMLPALADVRSHVDQDMALRIPDFSKPLADDNFAVGAEEFTRRTSDRLIENLTSGYHYDPGRVTMRDPADPQGPTRMHQLFKKEAVSLEQIWRDDFYQNEGLTVIYRESPAYLDEAMPLNIYTSMFWYVKLSRCGLVLNRNIPIAQVHDIDEALRYYESAHYNETSKEELAKLEARLKQNRFLTLGMAQFRYGRKDATGWRGDLSPVLKKVEGLFDD